MNEETQLAVLPEVSAVSAAKGGRPPLAILTFSENESTGAIGVPASNLQQLQIDEAKRRLPLPELLSQLGFGSSAKRNACCPLHNDRHPSFSAYQHEGKWFWKCHSRCGCGDEINFLRKHLGMSRTDAMWRYLAMAGVIVNSSAPPVPAKRKQECVNGATNESPELLETQLRALAEGSACTCAADAAVTKRFKLAKRFDLARGVCGLQLKLSRELNPDELTQIFDEWYRLSEAFLDPAQKRVSHWTAFLAEVQKVRSPKGEGALTKALENVSRLSLDKLPVIPQFPDENARRIAALHRELSRLSKDDDGKYFLSYRDAAKVSSGLSHQEAHEITLGLATLGAIKIISKGQARPSGGRAAEFRYLFQI